MRTDPNLLPRTPVISYEIRRSDGIITDIALYTKESWKIFHEGIQELVDKTDSIVINSGKRNDEVVQ